MKIQKPIEDLEKEGLYSIVVGLLLVSIYTLSLFVNLFKKIK